MWADTRRIRRAKTGRIKRAKSSELCGRILGKLGGRSQANLSGEESQIEGRSVELRTRASEYNKIFFSTMTYEISYQIMYDKPYDIVRILSD